MCRECSDVTRAVFRAAGTQSTETQRALWDGMPPSWKRAHPEYAPMTAAGRLGVIAFQLVIIAAIGLLAARCAGAQAVVRDTHGHRVATVQREGYRTPVRDAAGRQRGTVSQGTVRDNAGRVRYRVSGGVVRDAGGRRVATVTGGVIRDNAGRRIGTVEGRP